MPRPPASVPTPAGSAGGARSRHPTSSVSTCVSVQFPEAACRASIAWFTIAANSSCVSPWSARTASRAVFWRRPAGFVIGSDRPSRREKNPTSPAPGPEGGPPSPHHYRWIETTWRNVRLICPQRHRNVLPSPDEDRDTGKRSARWQEWIPPPGRSANNPGVRGGPPAGIWVWVPWSRRAWGCIGAPAPPAPRPSVAGPRTDLNPRGRRE